MITVNTYEQAIESERIMHPALTHGLAVQLATRLKDHVFHTTTHGNSWVGTTGGYQYYLWYADAIGPSPIAIRIEEIMLIMNDWNLDWYVRQVWSEWNRRYAPDAKKDAKRRVILDYREEALRHGRTQQAKATAAAAAKREQERITAATETVQWHGIELTLIRTCYPGRPALRQDGTDATERRHNRLATVELRGAGADRGAAAAVHESTRGARRQREATASV